VIFFAFAILLLLLLQHSIRRERGKWDFMFSIKTSSFGGLMILIQGFEICARIFFL
jgi:hypothetical protein